MQSATLDQVLRALDSMTAAQSVVVGSRLELISGSLPEGLSLKALQWTETSSWSQLDSWEVLMTRLRGHEGPRRRIVSFFAPLKDDQRHTFEALYRLAGLVESDQTRMARELDETRRMFQSVLDTIPVRVFWKDLNSVYLGSNRLFAQDAGLTDSDELIGKNDYDLSFREQADLYREDDRRVMTSGEAQIDYEEPQTTPTGDQIWLQTSKIPIRDVSDEIVGVLGTYRDITPRKDAEAEREALLEDLESKNAELERFTYTVSHDLKSPLVTIGGFLGMLEQDLRETADAPTPQAAFDSIERIRQATYKMSQLLEELLDISRVGRILHRLEPVPLRSLIDDALLLCDGALRETRAELKIQGDFPLVRVDGPRIVQVFQNLMDNACKYRDPDHPLVLEITADSNGWVRFEDNGIGIPEQYRERIFGLFEKLDPTTEGSGIGLALVQRIIEGHGQKVRVETARHGNGTAFHFVLPLAENQP